MKEFQKYIHNLAGRLIAQGLTAEGFTLEEAKKATENVVAPKFIHKLLEDYENDVLSEMVRLEVNAKYLEAQKNVEHLAPIVDFYKGYVILAQNEKDQYAKRIKITNGDTDGFYTIEQALNLKR